MKGRRVLKYLDAFVYFFFLSLRWCRLQMMYYADYFTESILGIWEETLKSVVREGFTNTTRFANGCFAWAVAIFVSKEQKEGARTTDTRTQAWKEWWQQERPSTLNAFIANSTPSSQKKQQSVPQRPPQNPTRHGIPWHVRFAQNTRTTAVRVKNGIWGVSNGKGGEKEMRRTGSDLFDRPSGYAVESSNKGLIEDVRMGLEMGVTKMINFFRICIRWTFRLPPKAPSHGIDEQPPLTRRNTAPMPAEGETWEEAIARPGSSGRRHSSKGGAAPKKLTPAGDAILAAGYPLQMHTVVTSDGYILEMERIPRPGVRDVVFFMHGILDTSMGWVANGTGSHAFSAYDQGMDVWLASSRSNPPRRHIDPKQPRSKYWRYTVNEMGMEDCIAQVDLIHTVKCQELHVNAGPTPQGISRTLPAAVDTLSAARAIRRSMSDSDLSAAGVSVVSAPPGEAATDYSSGEEYLSDDRRRREASAPPDPSPIVPASGRHRLRTTRSQPAKAGKAAKDTLAEPLQGNGMRTRSKGLGPQRTRSLQKHSAAPIKDASSADETEASPSPRWRGDSEGEDTFEELPGDTGLLTRTMDLHDHPSNNVRAKSLQLSPDRVSYDGVEVDRPSSTPTSRAREASAERRHQEAAAGGKNPPDPYRLRAVGHSLGGAALLVYITTQCLAKKPHHIYRLILLTPAGFLHHHPPVIAYPVMWFLPTWRALAQVFRRGFAMTIPTTMLRFLVFKLLGDMRSIPAFSTMVFYFVRSGLNGDVSQWDRATQMPHYSATSMPSISVYTGLHLRQWVYKRRFALFDHGKKANQRIYGQPEPLDVAANYGVLDCPVDLVAGTADGIINSGNVMEHYNWMKKAGCSVTYKEFNFGHLDFTFALKEELVYYVRSRVRLRH